MKSRAGSLLLLLASLCVCAIAGEAIVRLQTTRGLSQRGTHTKHHFNIYRSDSLLSHALRPNWSGIHEKFDFSVRVHTDAAGFRVGAVAGVSSPPPPDEAFRILVVGDSFAFGWGVEDDETFAAVLQQRLGGERAVEVINAAVPGYSADQYLLFLRSRGFALAPDLVLVSVCGNDVDELRWNQRQLGADRLPVRVQSLTRTITARGKMRLDNEGLLRVPTFRFSGDGWLVDHSHVYNLIRFQTMRLWIGAIEGRTRRQQADEHLPAAPIESLNPDAIERALSASEPFRISYHQYLMAAIERETRERGIALRTLMLEGVPEALRAACAPATCLDQATLFKMTGSEGMHFPLDRHWTAAGHRVVGEALATWLRDLAREPRS